MREPRKGTRFDVSEAHALAWDLISNVACTAATTPTLDSTGSVGGYTSLTAGEHTSVLVGADGFGLIGYDNTVTGDLKVAHCSNVFCVPHFRRR